jgi:hypothetical protein
MKFSRIFSFFLLALITTACNNQYSSNIANSGCNPPCFFGITPGLTNAIEVNELLSSSSFVLKDSILGSGMLKSTWYPISYSFSWEFSNGERGTVWLTSDSKVVYTEFKDPKLTLSQFIKLYGDPSSLLIVPFWGNKTYVYLVYPDIGVILEVRKILSAKDDLVIRSVDRIKTINYIDNSLLNSVIYFFVFGDEYELTPESKLVHILQAWSGFGKYKSIDYWNH